MTSTQVQQRLESVGPARAALKTAVMMEPPSKFELQAALKGIKLVRSLLDPTLVALAGIDLGCVTLAAVLRAYMAFASASLIFSVLCAGLEGFCCLTGPCVALSPGTGFPSIDDRI
jgi:hypothetical protein